MFYYVKHIEFIREWTTSQNEGRRGEKKTAFVLFIFFLHFLYARKDILRIDSPVVIIESVRYQATIRLHTLDTLAESLLSQPTYWFLVLFIFL